METAKNTMTAEEMIRLQAAKHDLIDPQRERSKEDYVLHLMHEFDYAQACMLARDKTVLDLGCNTGYGTAMLSKPAQKVVGVDVSEKALEIANKQYADLDIPFHLIDGKQLPFEKEEFNMTTSFQVIEHIVDYDVYIGELKRVLLPEGIALFTTPNSRLRLDPGIKPWNPFHVTEFDHASLGLLLKKYFSSVTVLGLFAKEPLYSIEKDRLDRQRANARRQNSKLNAAFYQKTLRTILKTVLPDSIISKLKKIQPASAAEAPIADKEFTETHGLQDLFYRKDGLEGALALLAICSDSPKSIEDSLVKLTIS